VQKNDNY